LIAGFFESLGYFFFIRGNDIFAFRGNEYLFSEVDIKFYAVVSVESA
jgi:hypothetical protein